MTPGWLPVVAAYLLDGWVGDPRWLPHPVCGIGALIGKLERRLFPLARSRGAQLAAGILLVITVVATVTAMAWGVTALATAVHPWLGAAVHACGMALLLARRSLADAVLAVYRPLAADDLPAARAAAGLIVGRDTDGLPAAEVARAAIETAAENTADGVVAPLLYGLIGGLPLMAAYKAVNTLDSMVGYRNERYLYFGRAAARLDDLANWVPARLTGLAMVAAAWLLRAAPSRAWQVLRDDAGKHPSPNSGWPEAAAAGALGVRLGGTNHYGGVPSHRLVLHAAGRSPVAADLPAAVRLLHLASHLCLVSVLLTALIATGVMYR